MLPLQCAHFSGYCAPGCLACQAPRSAAAWRALAQLATLPAQSHASSTGPTCEQVRPFGMSKFFQRFICVLAPLIAAGCSMANLMGTEDMRPEAMPEPDYRRIVAEGVKPNLKDVLAFG